MPVSVTVYYRDADDRTAELERTLARLRRRISLLRPGLKLDRAKERAGKVRSRIEDLDAEEADAKMRAKFHKDMADLAGSCRKAVSPSSVAYDEPADAPGAVVWDAAGSEVAGPAMGSAGLREVPSGDSVRYEFDDDMLDADGCNRIRLAVEAAARLLWEAHGGKKAEAEVRAGVHADDGEVLPRRTGGVNPYGVLRAACRIAARAARAARAGEGRGRASGGAGGLRVESGGEWMTPESELVLWVREAVKWIKREGPTGRDELEAQVGARAASDPSHDAELFAGMVSAVSAVGVAALDGKTVSPLGNKETEDAN